MNVDLVAQLVADGPMPLIRTDFSSDAAWQRVVDQASRASDNGDDADGYEPHLAPISDPGFESTTAEVLAGAWPRECHGYVILADAQSMSEATAGSDDVTVLLVDLSADDEEEEEFGWIFGQTFRSVASEIAGIEANLSLANMDFSEFADSVDDDGIFRGF